MLACCLLSDSCVALRDPTVLLAESCSLLSTTGLDAWPHEQWLLLTREAAQKVIERPPRVVPNMYPDESFFGFELEALGLPWRRARITYCERTGAHAAWLLAEQLKIARASGSIFARKVNMELPPKPRPARSCAKRAGQDGQAADALRVEARAAQPSSTAQPSSKAVMETVAVLEHFGRSHMSLRPSFRSLCNGLKAIGCAAAVKALRQQRKGRPFVLDLGCGKGGDLQKWIGHRPRKLLGLDGSSICINEARERHARLTANGRGSMNAGYEVLDLCTESARLPVEEDAVDIVSLQFFLQFAACKQAVFKQLLNEVARVLAPGGIFFAIVPDGDRVYSLLEQSTETTISFGHFTLCHCDNVKYTLTSPAWGVAYSFSLGEEACTEFLLLPQLLEQELRARNLAPLDDAPLTWAAQDFFLSYPDSSVAGGIIGTQQISHTDWLSLGLFRVALARKE